MYSVSKAFMWYVDMFNEIVDVEMLTEYYLENDMCHVDSFSFVRKQ